MIHRTIQLRIAHTASTESFHDLLVELASLSQRLTTEIVGESIFRRAQHLLHSLPLTTADLFIARQRLENVKRYSQLSETGAAVYELEALIRSVRSFEGSG